MGLFKNTPDKMYKSISKVLRKKDGNPHILVDVEPTNSMKSLNDRVNGIFDSMRQHGYEILRIEVMPHIHMQTSVVVMYK